MSQKDSNAVKKTDIPPPGSSKGRQESTETLQSCSLPEFRGFKKNPNDTLYLNENKLSGRFPNCYFFSDKLQRDQLIQTFKTKDNNNKN